MSRSGIVAVSAAFSALMLVSSTAAAQTWIDEYSTDFGSSTSSAYTGTDNWAKVYNDDWEVLDVSGTYPLSPKTDDSACTWGTTTTACRNHLIQGNHEGGNFRLTVETSSSDDDAIGLVFNYEDANNFYVVFMTGPTGDSPTYPAANGTHTSGTGTYLMKIDGGSATLLASDTDTIDVTPNQKKMRVQNIDGVIQFWYDANGNDAFSGGERIINYTDSSSPHGVGDWGLWAYNNDAVQFDDVDFDLYDADDDTDPDDTDCDDTDDTVYNGATELCDGQLNDCGGSMLSTEDNEDGDAYSECTLDSGGWDGSGTVTGGDDCDDSASTGADVYPGQTENCSNSIDDDCDTLIDLLDTSDCTVADADNDGDPDVTDCDDTDNTVYTGATELCDGQLNNCGGSMLSTEGNGDGDNQVECTLDAGGWDGAGTVTQGGDCDDTDATVYTGATELCDGQLNNCGGSMLSTEDNEDGDAYSECTLDSGGWDGSGTVTGGDDCDDSVSTGTDVYPGADELCDNKDNDCNSSVDDNLDETPPNASMQAGVCAGAQQVCSSGSWVDPDYEATIGTYDAVEATCDGLDNDCDSIVDEDDPNSNTTPLSLQTTYYHDSDGDFYGDATDPQNACSAPANHVSDSNDCDDDDINVNPGEAEECDGVDTDCVGGLGTTGATDETDSDGDTHLACTITTWRGAGGAPSDGDCDDGDGTVHVGATELCDGQLNACGGSMLATEADQDGDGFVECTVDAGGWDGSSISGGDDCLDFPLANGTYGGFTAAVYPGATELCDGINNDCSGSPGNWNTNLRASEVDNDGDGHVECNGNSAGWDGDSSVVGWNDCDDSSSGDGATVYVGAPELCDGITNNCSTRSTPSDDQSGLPDDEIDDDNDGHVECELDSGGWDGNGSKLGDDCNDSNAGISPSDAEICGLWGIAHVDEDCDGSTTNGLTFTDWYRDGDSDTYGDPNDSRNWCNQPTDYVTDDQDCDDTNINVNPVAQEKCNGFDDDCDGLVDIDDPTVDENDLGDWYLDSDSDGFGDATDSVESCDPITGRVPNNTDCDDSINAVNPNAQEICNGDRDDDCDGLADFDDPSRDTSTGPFWYEDSDSDGYGHFTLGINDCEAPTGYVGDNTDCDDGRFVINPGQNDTCNGVDNDCDGFGDVNDDWDGDGLAWNVETPGGGSDCDIDTDGDGVRDDIEWGSGARNTDGDDDNDINDDDDDNDNVPTALESIADADNDPSVITDALNTDTDGDGIPDYIDDDDDDDGLLTRNEDYSGSPNDPTDDDFDGDGTPNYLDIDDDEDMVPTECELFANSHLSDDFDGDGVGDGAEWFTLNETVSDYDELARDTNSDGVIDGWNAVSNPYSLDCLTPRDTDGDGAFDFEDDDDDNDGLFTFLEADIDSDGQVDNSDDPPFTGCTGDVLPNYMDLDSDGDGFNDNTFSTGFDDNWPEDLSDDNDLDGIVNYADCDDNDGCDGDNDFDGISNCAETCPGIAELNGLCSTATDLDTNPLQADTDLDGLCDGTILVAGICVAGEDAAGGQDTDGDGTIDALEPDDDGDGVLTEDEDYGGNLTVPNPDGDPTNDDTDGDSIPDYLDDDDDGDGELTIDELDVDCVAEYGTSAQGTPDDCDCDDIPNYLDEFDNDGACGDSDFDGLSNQDEVAVGSDPFDKDSDGDGRADFDEYTAEGPADCDADGTPDAAVPYDADCDGTPDILDTDDDGDGIDNAIEGDFDADADGIPNSADDDSDGDGKLDADEGTGDDDNDGIPNFLDADDTDGLLLPDTGEMFGGFDTAGDDEGCGCSGAPAPANGLPFLLLGLLAIRRRSA